MKNRNGSRTDVIILGSGLAGSIAALCLRRQGLAVTLIDQGTHPRFALGESTTTPASLWLRVLASRFEVPELLNLASAEAISKNVAATSGVKNNFGYLYHACGEPAPLKSWQAIIPQAFMSDYEHEQQSAQNEMHYFRQDVDAYLWATALTAGVVGRPATLIADQQFDDEGVQITTTAGETIRGRFLIDASGYRSPVAKHLGLRDETPKMRTNSRSLFTHMVGVKHYEDTKLVADSMALWSQGTLHHFFDGGWIWVIPFNNHRDSTNRLCSVGVNFDNSRFPKREGVSAEEEWSELLSNFPSIAAQFTDAVPVRPWVHTDRLQYSSKDCAGDRYWLTSHTAGTVDALYSMGNINNFQTLAVGLSLIVDAFRDNIFKRERMKPVQDLTDTLLRFQDQVVYGSYAGLRAPKLMSTWIAMWSLTDTARIRKVLIPLVKYVRTGNPADLEECLADPANILTGIGMHTGFTDAGKILNDIDVMCDIMADLENGETSIDEASERLNEAAESKPEYCINLKEMEHAFTRIPWIYKPLAQNGLRCHGACFMHYDELQSLGIES